MQILEILKTDESPYILFNPNEGFLMLEGKSLPEDIKEFYDPLENAVLSYIKDPRPKTTVKIYLYYLNSSSTKRLLQIISHLENLYKCGYEVNLMWYCLENDEDMMEEGEEFARLTELPLQIIRITE